MTVVVGSTIRASEFNAVAEVVNKIFGDKYSTASVTDVDKSNHIFGWGAANVDDSLAVGDIILAHNVQGLIDRTNIMLDHIAVADTRLVFAVPSSRDNVTATTLIRAEDLNVLESTLISTVLATGNHLTIDPTNASALTTTPTGGPYTRTTLWETQLVGEHKWTFGNYNHARYFFNSGGQLRLSTSMSGGTTPGYTNWATIMNDIGVLNFTHDNCFQSGGSYTLGTSEGKGFYDLTDRYGDGSDIDGVVDDEGLIFTSTAISSPAYGYGYGYGYGYSPAPTTDVSFKLYAKYGNAGSDVIFKLMLDDSLSTQTIDGTLAVILSHLMPDIITENLATFDVSPSPTATIINTFTSADDS